MGMNHTSLKLSEAEMDSIIAMPESWILDKKGKNIKPSKLSKSISAFANTNGGELFIGISHEDNKNMYYWDGFTTEEDTNQIIALLDNMFPTFDGYNVQSCVAHNMNSIILHITIFKNKTIIYASDGKAYIRHGVQNLPCNTDDKILRLKMDKGEISYEDVTTQCVFSEIKNSNALTLFLNQVVPQTTPYDWLHSQKVMDNGTKITVAGVLLYNDCPQATLPKQSAIKILRYRTDDKEGSRKNLDSGFPITIEGDIYTLIKVTVAKVIEIVESSDVVGSSSIERKKYPSVALHEIITNAVLHRDYSILKDIQVRIYTNRIEVESPGLLPGHITVKNILHEQLSRNAKIVRLISKFPSPPNKDVGEGLNTAFAAMLEMHLQEPKIIETETSVIVIVKHERLADSESAVMDYLRTHKTISNRVARAITGITDANKMKRVFYRLKSKGYLEIVPGTKSTKTLWYIKKDGYFSEEEEEIEILEQLSLF